MPKHPVKQPEWIESAPLTLTNSIEIAAPPEAVWAQVADHESWSEWFTTLEQVEVTGSPTGVGGSRRVTVKRLGLDEVFTKWDVNERFAFSIVGSKMPFLEALAEDVHLEPIGSGCRITYRQGIECKRGFGWLARPVFGSLETSTAEALGNLKQRCERDD